MFNCWFTQHARKKRKRCDLSKCYTFQISIFPKIGQDSIWNFSTIGSKSHVSYLENFTIGSWMYISDAIFLKVEVCYFVGDTTQFLSKIYRIRRNRREFALIVTLHNTDTKRQNNFGPTLLFFLSFVRDVDIKNLIFDDFFG